MKIMVIDDVFMNILRLKEAVRPFGDADGFQNAREGLEALQFAYLTNDRYDLLFLDIVMPEMSGFDVLKAVVKMGAGLSPKERTKVVMVTARNQEESVREAIRNGASGYVIKPFQDERIHGEIQRLTGVSPGSAGAQPPSAGGQSLPGAERGEDAAA
jgi:two-component system chemotaxis response regulator CheY